MPIPIAELLTISFQQAAKRGIPASEIIPPLAKKFDLRPDRIIESLVASKQIHTTQFCGSTILWHARSHNNPTDNKNMRRQISADLLQAGVNLGLANGDLPEETLHNSPPEVILRDLIPAIIKSADPPAISESQDPAAA